MKRRRKRVATTQRSLRSESPPDRPECESSLYGHIHVFYMNCDVLHMDACLFRFWIDQGASMIRFARLPFAIRFTVVVLVVFLVIFAQHVIHPVPS